MFAWPRRCVRRIAPVTLHDAWHFTDGSRLAFASAGIAFLSSALIFIPMAREGRLTGRRLLTGGAFYLVYLIAVVAALAGIV